MKQEFYAVAQLMGWVDGDLAAQEVMGAERAVSDRPIAEIKASFSVGGENKIVDEKHSGNKRQSDNAKK